MVRKKQKFKLITTSSQLKQFYKKNQDIDWLAFDTEFIGEKYYNEKLCLISAYTKHGLYIFDTLELDELDLFLELINNKTITKITHAGENDYRILINDYDARPRNIFDTQIAAGFLGYDYPTSLRKLLKREFDIRLDKSLTLSNWEERPLSDKQIKYALDDVAYLYDLMLSFQQRLSNRKRLSWVIDECKKLGVIKNYQCTLPERIINSNFVYGLRNEKEKLLCIRLLRWRIQKAKKYNRPEKRILSNDALQTIVRLFHQGKESIKNDRRINPRSIDKQWEKFSSYYQKPPNKNEKILLDKLIQTSEKSSSRDMLIELLYFLIKYKAKENNITPELVISRREISKMKENKDYYPAELKRGWRREFLGNEMTEWLQKKKAIDIEMKKNKCILTLR